MSAPPLVPGQPRNPKERSGCAVALYALFGIGVLVIVGSAAAVYIFLQSERGQEIVGAAKRGVEWMSVATAAPGTQALRGAGCEVALANSAGGAIDAVLPLLPGDIAKEDLLLELEQETGGDLSNLTLVLCTLPQFATSSLTCEEYARTYTEGVEFPPDEFALFVVQQGNEDPHCSGLYTSSGELLRAFEE